MAVQNNMSQRIIGILTWEAVENAIRQHVGNGVRTVLFGIERADGPGAAEDVVDIIAKYDACLVSLLSKRPDSSQGVCIYVNASDVKSGHVPELQEELSGLGEILYFKSIE